MNPHLVLDTNVLVSAALWPLSPPGQVVRRALRLEALVACAESMGELERVLLCAKFDQFAPPQTRNAFVEMVRGSAEMVELQAQHRTATHGACRDPDDELFLALALAAPASCIVSGDQDLLTLHPWRGVAIRTPADYLAANE